LVLSKTQRNYPAYLEAGVSRLLGDKAEMSPTHFNGAEKVKEEKERQLKFLYLAYFIKVGWQGLCYACVYNAIQDVAPLLSRK